MANLRAYLASFYGQFKGCFGLFVWLVKGLVYGMFKEMFGLFKELFNLFYGMLGTVL